MKKTQQDVANEISRSVRTYRKWENDQARPQSFQDILRVCEACAVPVADYVAGRHSQPYPDRVVRQLAQVAGQLSVEDQRCLLKIAQALLTQRCVDDLV